MSTSGWMLLRACCVATATAIASVIWHYYRPYDNAADAFDVWYWSLSGAFIVQLWMRNRIEEPR